ncbi:MAG: HAD-superfamily subfamily hydrolase [Candidatus Saccharibacteria bacterium]|nr:HAD-superfamily subfamily hydrolase [Candidatus Saccharibacteria bacterium]
MARPFAAFDIDGTIIRWQLYHAIGDALARAGHIEPEAFSSVKAARMDWKRRTGNDGFAAYEHRLVEVFDNAMRGLSVSEFEAATEVVFEEYKDQVYTYTRDLIRDLQSKGYLLFAISGSPSVIVQKFAAHYGFDDFAATNYEVNGGVFTGIKDLSVGKKPQLLAALIGSYEAATAGSIAVGDSEGDIDMLAMTEQPIAFNPTRGLYEHARANGWQIVLERKNVVYELSSREGSYKLND